MRMIDADALKAALLEENYECRQYCYPCKTIIKAIDAAPTVQPERQTGKWIWMGEHGDSRFMCSVCKSKENVPTVMGKPDVWWYCPNCGARMEG